MVDITFPNSSAPGAKPGEMRGRLINAFAIATEDGLRWIRVPGLKSFADTVNKTGPRGFLALNAATLYAAYEAALVSITPAGLVTPVGTLSGTQPVTMSRNNKAPVPDVAIVTENGAFLIASGSSSIVAWPDPDLPQPNSVSFLNGYFLFTLGDGRIFASNLNDPAINALSFAKAEAKPDGLLRGIVSGSTFYGFGPDSIEAWSDRGTSPFPLGRDTVIPIGLAGPWAVAGHESGWELAPIFAASDGTVRLLRGYQAEKVSTPDVERSIAAVPDKNTLEATVYVTNGNAIWSLSSPTWTWEYNVSTNRWHERQSYSLSRWRARWTVKSFDRWLVGDTQSSKLLEIRDDTYTEDASALVWTLISKPSGSFPRRFRVPRADFAFTTGMGVAVGPDNLIDPSALISWSDDGGATWSTPLSRSLGREGRYQDSVTVLNCGWSTRKGRMWKLQISDAVYVALEGGTMDVFAGLPDGLR